MKTDKNSKLFVVAEPYKVISIDTEPQYKKNSNIQNFTFCYLEIQI